MWEANWKEVRVEAGEAARGLCTCLGKRCWVNLDQRTGLGDGI